VKAKKRKRKTKIKIKLMTPDEYDQRIIRKAESGN